MSNKHCDETGYNWQNYGENGSKVQENSKTYDGVHTWYNSKTGVMGQHGENASNEVKKFGGHPSKY